MHLESELKDKFECNGCYESYFTYNLIATCDNFLYCCDCNFKRVNEKYLNTFSY